MNSENQAEATLAAFWNYREKGSLDPAITTLQGLGYPEQVVKFALDPDSYFIPNIRGDRIVRPSGVGDDKIPVVALENGRSYSFEAPSLHYLQSLALADARLVTAAETGFATQSADIAAYDSPAGTASNYARRITIGATTVEARPTIVLNQEGGQSQPEDAVSPLMHEIAHLVQKLADPRFQLQNRLDRELEAFAVQATLVGTYDIPYTPSTRTAGEVELFRERRLGYKNYTADSWFINEFKREPLFARIVASLQ